MQHSRSPRERVPAEAAMRQVLTAQSAHPVRTSFARVFGVGPLASAGKHAYVKALGELIVGEVLSGLGQRWDVLHEISVRQNSIIDHLVIGPAGVFTIHVVNCRDRDVVVNGMNFVVSRVEHDDLRCAAAEADAAAQALEAASGAPVRVRPLLVVVDPRRLNVKLPASIVRVIVSQELERFLLKAPTTLDGDEVARFSDLADRATTWPAGSTESVDTLQLSRDFERVRSQVRAARRRRTAWSTVGIVLIYIGVCGCIATLVTLLIHGQ